MIKPVRNSTNQVRSIFRIDQQGCAGVYDPNSMRRVVFVDLLKGRVRCGLRNFLALLNACFVRKVIRFFLKGSS